MTPERSRLQHHYTFLKKNKFLLSALLLIGSGVALADQMPVIIVGGQDQSGSLGAVGNIVQTIQHVALNWIAPLFGTGLAIYGIYKIALRETMIGTIALLCGGAMFFVKNILEGLRAMTGAG